MKDDEDSHDSWNKCKAQAVSNFKIGHPICETKENVNQENHGQLFSNHCEVFEIPDEGLFVDHIAYYDRSCDLNPYYLNQ